VAGPRAVLDTSVLVSAILRPDGPSGAILRAARRGRFVMITSPAILDELVDVLTRPKLLEGPLKDRSDPRPAGPLARRGACAHPEDAREPGRSAAREEARGRVAFARSALARLRSNSFEPP
jgi:predicted nucleic acid-binding protein